MNTVELTAAIDIAIDIAIAQQWYGKASAVKSDRNPAFPYAPVIETQPGVPMRQLPKDPTKGITFATREEAVAFSQKLIDSYIAHDKKAELRKARKAYK
jgi:hypothetical protein